MKLYKIEIICAEDFAGRALKCSNTLRKRLKTFTVTLNGAVLVVI